MVAQRAEYVLGVDVGGTYIRMGVVSRDLELRDFRMVLTQTLYGDEDPKDPVRELIDSIKRYGAEWENELIALSIGFPSIISKDKRTIYSSPNLPGFDRVPIADLLEREFRIPIFVDNDVNHLLLYDIQRLDLFHEEIIAGFYIGTGLGNAIYIAGKLLSGKNGTAAELGHIPVMHRHDPCGCGNAGCIELYASGKRLQEICRKHFPDTDIRDVFVKHGGSGVIQDFIEAIAIAVSTEINILDPDHVIIGGGVVNMDRFPKAELERYIKMHVRKPYPADRLSIIYTTENQKAGVAGAAYSALRRLHS